MSTKNNLESFYRHLESKGLTKEAEYLSSMLDEMDDAEGMDDMDEAELIEKEELVEFDEAEAFEGLEEDLGDLPTEDMGDEGGEFSFEGQTTASFHCCPEAKDAMSSLCDMAGSEEEKDLCMEIMEEVDSFLSDKISLMEGGGSKEDLCDFMNKGLSAMYVVGQASGVMDEDVAQSFQFVADAIEEVCSELLEE